MDLRGIFSDEQRLQEVLREPYTYVTQVPGKDVRTLLIHAFNLWLEVPDEKIEIVKEITKMLHNASLLIDDIEDNSKLRRGIPSAHTVYGVPQTINSANYIYFECLEKVIRLNEPRAVKIFAEQLLELHRGQGMDIYWRDSVQCPSEDEYREMVKRKTGGLFKLAVQLMQLFSKNQSDFDGLLDALGLYFQIRDDYANLVSDEYAENKSFCEDLTEGKFSFPIIHAILSDKSSHQVINIVKQRTNDLDLKRHCVAVMRKAGSFEYTKKVMDELVVVAHAEVDRLGGNKPLTELIHKLASLHQP